MKRTSPSPIKYTIGFLMTLIAVSNCFNVLSNSSLFVASPSADVSRDEATKLGSQKLSAPLSAGDKLDGGRYLFLNSPLIPANRPATTTFADFRPAGLASPFATSLTATKTDNTSAAVNPGDTIMYTVVITNTGGADATNVIFTDTVDPNTTLVAGSVNSSPIAFNDTYTATGNIPIAPATSVLVNDIDPDSGTNAGLTVTQVQGSGANVGNPVNTTATGIGSVHGSVTLFVDGSFTYEAPPGFTGADTFTYQISDAAGKTGVGTVTINVSNMVWFIDNTAAASLNRGTFSQPFKTIAAFNAVNTGAAPNPQNGHHVVLRPASGSYAEADGINLRDSQTLTGPAVAFSTVFAADANSTSAYNSFAGSTGTAAVITATAGDGVGLGSGNAVRGLNVGNTSGFGFNGGAVGSLTIGTVSKTGTGGAINVSTSGAFGSNVTFTALDSANSAAQGINLVSVTGTLAVTNAGSGISAPTGDAVHVNGGSVTLSYPGNITKNNAGSVVKVEGGHTTGTLTFTGTLSATTASAGNGLQFDNADGTYNFNGTTTLNAGDAGIDILNNSGGTFNFGSGTTITNPTGTAFNVGTSPGSPTVTYSGSISQSTSGQRVINIDTTTSNTITFNTGTITGGASSSGININAANGNVTFSNGLTLGTSGGRMTNQAATITGGSGTYSLGTISIFTNNAKGIVCTNADGTLNITGGSVDTSGATAIDIDGPAGLTALGVALTSVTSAGGTADGISIQNTNGSFTVNGDGANTSVGGNSTGGTISNKSGADGSTSSGIGIYLNNVTNITLRRMTINGTNQNFAILGATVTGCTMEYSTVAGTNGTNDSLDEGSISFTGLTGSATFTNDNLSGGWEDNLRVNNVLTGGTLNRLTVTNTTFGSNSVTFGNSALNLQTGLTGVLNVTVTGSTFTGSRSTFVQYLLNGSGTPSGDFVFTNNTITQSMSSIAGAGGVFVSGSANASPALTFKIQNNIIHSGTQTITGTDINVSHLFGGTSNGIIDSNTIGTAGVVGSGSTQGSGIAIIQVGGGTYTVNVTNNTVRRYNDRGIFVQVGDNTTGGQGTVNATITGNTVAEPDSFGLHGLHLNIGTTTGDAMIVCATVGGAGALKNILTGSGVVANGGFDIESQQRRNTTIHLPGYGGANNDNSAVATFLAAQNTTGGTGAMSISNNVSGGGGGYLGGAACTQSLISSIVNPVKAESLQTNPTSDSPGSGVSTVEGILRAARGEGPYSDDLQKLKQEELNWMVQAALARWIETGISAEDLARLQAVTFQISDLPNRELASIAGTNVTIDESAAGYGWFFDQSPTEDSEFQVPVPEKELHAAHLSPARGKMDLLTVVMREHAQIYLQGKTKLTKSTRQILQPMMESTLSPGVRRLPLGQWKITAPASTVGKASPATDTRTTADASAATQASTVESKQPAAVQADNNNGGNVVASVPAARGKIPAGARHAVFNPATDIRTASGAVLKFNNARDAAAYAAIRARRAGSMTPFSGGTVTVNGAGTGFTIPVGKSVTIMFNVTVNAANTFPPGTTQVCNQGSVSGSNFTTVQTDDPDVAGSQSTCTALNVADLSVTKSAGSGTTCSTSNIVYTIGYHNAGPANALGVVVSDVMPAGTSLVSAPAPANWSRTDSVPNGGNGTIMFSRTGASTNGESATFTVTVSVDGTVADGAVLSNTASVTSTTPDPDTANNTSSPATTVTVKKPPTTATVGGPQTICALSTTTALGGNTPTIGTGTWTVQSGGTGTFNPNATTPGATFTHATGAGPVVLRWTISNPPCADSFAEVTVTIRQSPTATVGGPQTICALGTTTTLGGNTPTAPATGLWTIVTGGVTGTFNPNATTPGATFTHTSGAIGSTATLRWTVSNAPCTNATADVVITIKSQPTATAGGPQTICSGGTTASLGGNTPPVGATGTWSIVTAGITGTFSPNATTPGATFTHSTGATSPFTLRWTVTNAPCTTATADVTITLQAAPISTNGGPQTICDGTTTASLGGNTPAIGETGAWSIVTGGATGTFNPNATTPGATFTPTSGPGVITLRWTVTNATCGASATSDAVITVKQQPTATVGGPQTICALGTTASLGGNTPAGGATGTWSIVTAGQTGTFNPNATTPGATFTHATGAGPITLRWTVTNAPCTSATADVVITITQPPTTATVGGPQTICDASTTAGLGGNTPVVGSGLWTIQTGGAMGTFNPNAATPGATFTPTSGPGTIVLRWTISSPPCTASFAEVTITVKQQPTATVGGPQTICALGTTASLGGNNPAGGATGTWTVQGGGTGTFNPNANSPTATFTHTSGTGPITLRWTVTNAPCTQATADVVITITQSPTTATVGGPQTICALSTTAGLGGNTPTSGTGTWTVQSGGAGTFNPNAATPNATFTHTSGTGPIVVRWTIASAPCPASFAEVTITITQSPTTATVGGPQTICALSTTSGLGGNTPTSGAGTWTVQSGGTGTFNPNANTGNATFTHTSGTGPIVLRWTIANAPCPASFAEVTITITQSPTTATVGGPQTICALSTTAGLGGNTPTSGVGTWTVQSGGGGTFSPNANTGNATFTHTSGTGPIVLRWTIASAPCPSSFAEVTITISQQPTTATVGGPQTICASSTTASLGGNTPTSGMGMWTQVSGPAGTFNPNAAAPGATFTASNGPGTVVVRWTISSPPCPDSFAEVTITVKQQPTATTGGNQTICALSTSASLGGNTPAGGATGLWTIVTGGATGTFNPNATTPGATFTHTGGAGPITLRWTVSNAPCTAATADVILTITQPPTTATAGGNQTITPGGTTAGLGGNSPVTGAGMWSIVTAGFTGTFNPNATTPNATWTHLTGSGQVVLRWTISNAPCPASTADVTIQIGVAPTITCPSSPVVASATTGQCQAPVSFTVTATGIPTATVACTPPSGSTFPVGNTTVNCTAMNGVSPNASCSFTVQVNDTQPPVFTSGCPAAINTAAPATCPFTSSGVVTYSTPAATDNCPGVMVACNPPSGGMFPVGTTTVTCTATDAPNNTTQCTFPVTVASLCVQDDTNPGNVVLVNVNTGGYRFCCNGVIVATATTAVVTTRGCVVTITDTTNNRNVQISIDGTQNKGSASIRIGSTMLCTITDRKLTNNTCVCN